LRFKSEALANSATVGSLRRKGGGSLLQDPSKGYLSVVVHFTNFGTLAFHGRRTDGTNSNVVVHFTNFGTLAFHGRRTDGTNSKSEKGSDITRQELRILRELTKYEPCTAIFTIKQNQIRAYYSDAYSKTDV
jgi:hypothetical protein